MATVTDAVTDQVRADTDVRVALKAACTAEGLGVLESCDDEAEPVVGGAPAVRVVAEGDVVGPGDDEPVAAHRAGLGITRDVSLTIQYSQYHYGEAGTDRVEHSHWSRSVQILCSDWLNITRSMP